MNHNMLKNNISQVITKDLRGGCHLSVEDGKKMMVAGIEGTPTCLQ